MTDNECATCEFFDHNDNYCTAFECNGIECPKLPCEKEGNEE